MDNKILKDIIHNFLQSELKEIRENKIRVVAVTLFSLATIFFMLFDVEYDYADLNESSQSEIIQPVRAISENNEIHSQDEIIATKKNTIVSNKQDVSLVVGANSEDLFISDPFSVIEPEPKIENNVVKKTTNSQQIPMIPAMSPDVFIEMPSNFSQDTLSSEKFQITEEFFLTGIIIGDTSKNALVRKIFISNDKIIHEENMVVEVGDYLQGHKIEDITENFLVFDENDSKMNLSCFEYLDNEIPAINESFTESLNIEKDFATSINSEASASEYENDLHINTDNLEILHKKIQPFCEITENKINDVNIQSENVSVDIGNKEYLTDAHETDFEDDLKKDIEMSISMNNIHEYGDVVAINAISLL